MPGNWLTLDEARADNLWDDALSDILKSGRVGITGRIDKAPPHRILRSARSTPSHIEELLARAVGPIRFGADNKLFAVILWESGAPPLEADTCVLTDVRVYWPELADELEAAGYRVASRGRAIGDRAKRGARSHQSGSKQRPKRESPRGPKPGTTGFGGADRAMFPEIDEMLEQGRVRSVVAAARVLAREDKIRGHGSPDSRATRLARRYGQWKSATTPEV